MEKRLFVLFDEGLGEGLSFFWSGLFQTNRVITSTKDALEVVSHIEETVTEDR